MSGRLRSCLHGRSDQAKGCSGVSRRPLLIDISFRFNRLEVPSERLVAKPTPFDSFLRRCTTNTNLALRHFLYVAPRKNSEGPSFLPIVK